MTTSLSRRRFLERLIATGAVTAGGLAIAGCTGDERAPLGSARAAGSDGAQGAEATEPTGRLVPGAVGDRVLVVVDLQGGNDGLSTLVPYASGRYHDLRPNLAVDPAEVLRLDDEVGLHPSLRRLAEREVMTVEGVGPIDGGLSHFDMTARWARGDVTGTETGLRTGFLGRLVDALDDASPLVGLSLGAPTPHLTNRTASTMSLSSADELWFLQPSEWAEASAFQAQVGRFASERAPAGPADGGAEPAAPELVAEIGRSYGRLLDLGATLSADGTADWDVPMLAEGGDLGWKLHTAAEVIAADVGTRVVYVGTGDYDTHAGHAYRQADNLARLDVAVDGFLAKADALGFADRVAVATVSEFGRRVPENNSGLDHGSASTMLVVGPVGDVRAGDRPPLDDLDDDDNLRVTVGFDRYLASLAEEWLGVEAASVLPGEATPLGLF